MEQIPQKRVRTAPRSGKVTITRISRSRSSASSQPSPAIKRSLPFGKVCFSIWLEILVHLHNRQEISGLDTTGRAVATKKLRRARKIEPPVLIPSPSAPHQPPSASTVLPENAVEPTFSSDRPRHRNAFLKF